MSKNKILTFGINLSSLNLAKIDKKSNYSTRCINSFINKGIETLKMV